MFYWSSVISVCTARPSIGGFCFSGLLRWGPGSRFSEKDSLLFYLARAWINPELVRSIPIQPGTVMTKTAVFRSIRSLAAGMAFFAGAASLFAQNVLFYDHFNYPANAAPGGAWNVAAAPDNGLIEVRQDTENRFGRGTENHYLYWSSSDGAGAIRIDAYNLWEVGQGPAVFTIAFEFIELTDPLATNQRNRRFAIRTYTGTGYGNQLQQVDFRDLRLADSTYPGLGYANNTLSRFDYVVNTTAETISYDSPAGEVTLAGGRSDVWIDGVRVAPGLVLTEASMGTLTGFDLRNFSSNVSAIFLIDDIGIVEGAFVGTVIPEPGTYALLFGAAGLALGLLRRLRR
jgi:hypothetical protein